jgi:ATP-binding cassette subfamily B (MDR/TAP) protein 1
MGTLLLSLAMCISGLFFAFFRGWAMSLILMAAFPVVFIMVGFFVKAMQSGFSQNLQAYGQSAGYAEQALNAVKVVQAFGQEPTEMRNYENYLGKTKSVGIKTHFKSSIGLGSMFFMMLSFYSYGFYTGSWLVTK